MSEKKKFTSELIMDFETSHLLEVYLKDKWREVAAEYFRSYTGLRRISRPEKVKGGRIIQKRITVPYKGSVYAYLTNIEVTPVHGVEVLIDSPEWEGSQKISLKRG